MAQVNVGPTIKQWRSWTTRSVDELAAVGTAFIWSLGLEPLPETTAADQITRRTIRYYISNGVIDPPEGERRLASYNYRHLLQLIFVKARQHAGDRLDEIRDTGSAIDLDDLEERVIEVLPDSVSPPLPDDPSEFAQAAQRSAVLARWAYLTGRQGRWPTRIAPESVAYSIDEPAEDAVRHPGPFDLYAEEHDRLEMPPPPAALHSAGRPSQVPHRPRHLVHILIDDEMELTVPADHPLVHDEGGREFVLRGIRRLIRDYLRGSRPAGRED